VSFHRPVSVYDLSSRRHLTTTVAVLAFAIVGALSAILIRGGAAQADVSIVELGSRCHDASLKRHSELPTIQHRAAA
jgi:hypothetical protein